MVGMELPRESEELIAAARRLFAGRDGRIALTLLLALTAAVEASIDTPDDPQFPFEGGGGDPSAAVLLNVLAVLPLLAANRFPFVAAATASLISLVILASPETVVTLSALGVLLYAIGRLVAQRGLLLASPLLFLFFVNAIVPLDGDGVDLASIGPFLFVVAAALAGESSRMRTEAVTALDETQAAMAESVREQMAMEERAAIARELHDIVAHHLSMIAVQSETARLTSPKLSADARGRFEAIAATARDALTETAGCSEFCARTSTAMPNVRRSRASTSSGSSSTRREMPDRTSVSSCRARSSRFRPASTSPDIASSRRH